MRKNHFWSLAGCLTYLTVMGLVLGPLGQVRAQGYDLSILVKQGDSVDGKTLVGATSARLNDNGLIAFQGSYTEGGFSREGNFTFDGTTGSFLVSVSQNGPSEVCGGKTLSGGNQRALSTPRLNNNDLATFFAKFPGIGIFTHDGTTCTFIGGSQGGLLEINDDDVIAHGVSQPAIVLIELLPGGPVSTVVAQQGDTVAGQTITNTNGLALRLNNNNVVVFHGEFSDGKNRIVTSSGGSLSLVAEPGTMCGATTIANVLYPDINDDNDVVFSGTDTSGAKGLFRVSDSGCSVVVQEGSMCGGAALDDIQVDRQHKMNNDGAVVFVGNFAGGSRQLFAQSDGECVGVAKTGDPVDGATITGGFSVAGASINNGGDIVFETQVDDSGTSRKAIILAEPILDSDEDGIPDDEDECPTSDLSATVVIDGCDTGVENLLDEMGCTISDLIEEIAVVATNHGQFVSGVAQLANELKKAGIITGKEKGAIQSCASQAAIP